MFIRGFTLIEILVTISILGILAAVILSTLNSARDKANVALVQSELRSAVSAMAILYNDTGFYPNAADNFCRTSPPADNEVDLSVDAAGIVANGSSWIGWDGPYMQDMTDPWGTPYFLDEDYDCTVGATGCRGEASTSISVLVSCGPDTDDSGSGGSCTYNDDNIVYRLCD